MLKRAYLIVLDSVGVGEAPDAKELKDVGSDTLGHTVKEAGLIIPHLEKPGLGTIVPLIGVKAMTDHNGYTTKLEEISAGEDAMTGHQEIMGSNIKKPFRVFPDGFSEELLEQIEDSFGRKVVCNKPYSGTATIDDYGEHQMKIGNLTVYTSVDPVLRIAMHEGITSLEELYKICQYVRDIMKDKPYMIGWIIARPYADKPDNLTRTNNRHDYALDPFGHTALDSLKENSNDAIAIGKINGILNGRGTIETIRMKGNTDGMDQLLAVINKDFTGLSFTNLMDSDVLYGYRRDATSYTYLRAHETKQYR